MLLNAIDNRNPPCQAKSVKKLEYNYNKQQDNSNPKLKILINILRQLQKCSQHLNRTLSPQHNLITLRNPSMQQNAQGRIMLNVTFCAKPITQQRITAMLGRICLELKL